MVLTPPRSCSLTFKPACHAGSHWLRTPIFTKRTILRMPNDKHIQHLKLGVHAVRKLCFEMLDYLTSLGPVPI